MSSFSCTPVFHVSWFRFGNTADRKGGTPEQTTGPVPGTGRSKSGKRKKSNKSEVTKTFRGKRNLWLVDSATIQNSFMLARIQYIVKINYRSLDLLQQEIFYLLKGGGDIMISICT